MEVYLDLYNGTYEEKVTQLYQEIKQQSRIVTSNGYEGSNREYDTHYDFTPTLLKKRIAATAAYQLFARNELGDIASSELLNDMFAFSNGMILRGGYTNSDISFSVFVASAIWILDQLKIQGDLEKIYPYLPSFNFNFEEFAIHHPQYDDNLILSVISLIYYRNEKDYSKNDSLTILPLSRGNSEPRKAYDAVIELIDKDAISAVKEKYECKVWEFYRLAFSAYIKMQDEEERIEKEIEELQKKVMRQSPAYMQNGLFGSSDATTEKIQRLQYKLDRFKHTAWFTEIGLSDSREKTARKFRDVIGEEMVKKLNSFSVDDPFDYAFALHILLDEESMIPWLYYGSICVTYTFVDQLPFVNKFAAKGNPMLICDANSILYTHRFKGIRWKDAMDCSGEPVERTFGKNLGQILYYSSHTLYPRVANEMPKLDNFFGDIASENENEKQLYALLIYLLGSTNKEQISLQAYRLSREIEKMAENDGDNQDDIATPDLEKTIEGLKGRVEALSSALYEEDRSRKNITSKYNELLQDNERLVRELADLREIVFAQQSDEPIEAELKEEIKFPVLTSGKIVSFGGHPSWINDMKKLLPNVIFYSPEVIPNKDVIKNADQVWIQTNCISHAAFYRIESAIGEKTQLRFFPNQNARACAEKIALSLKK